MNFRRVDFRENIPQQNMPNWPDGTALVIPAAIIGPINVVNRGGNVNIYDDLLQSGLYPVARLGTPPQNHRYDVRVPFEFQRLNGD